MGDSMKKWKMILNILILLSLLSYFYFNFKADAVNPSIHDVSNEEVQLFADYHSKIMHSRFCFLILIGIRLFLHKKSH